jgi:hypothetical protein
MDILQLTIVFAGFVMVAAVLFMFAHYGTERRRRRRLSRLSHYEPTWKRHRFEYGLAGFTNRQCRGHCTIRPA